MKELALHLIDLTQNAFEAGSSQVDISVTQSCSQGVFHLIISDNGKGISQEMLQEVTDPFTTTRQTRRVGMGLSLMKQNAERTGGYLKIASQIGVGTTVEVMVHHHHIDSLPLGAWSQSVAMLLTANEQIAINYTHTTDQGQYRVTTEMLLNILDGVPLANPEVITFIQEMIEENLEEIDVFEGYYKGGLYAKN